MYLLSYLYLSWVNFWRLPESAQTRRTLTAAYQRKLHILRLVWLALVISLAALGQPVALISGIILMTFLTFMVLDEL